MLYCAVCSGHHHGCFCAGGCLCAVGGHNWGTFGRSIQQEETAVSCVSTSPRQPSVRGSRLKYIHRIQCNYEIKYLCIQFTTKIVQFTGDAI